MSDRRQWAVTALPSAPAGLDTYGLAFVLWRAGYQGLQRSPAAHRAPPPRSWCGCRWRASLSGGKVKFNIRGVSNINYNNKFGPEHLNMHFCF